MAKAKAPAVKEKVVVKKATSIRNLAPEAIINYLRYMFYCVLVFRFLIPFFIHPLDVLRSDPGRHWKHGSRLFEPTLSGSFDPKLYQVWLSIVRHISGEEPQLVSFFTGLLCAAMAIVWYKALREFFDKKRAYMIAIVIGITPSFAAVFGFFLNQTLLLVMMGLSIWLTFRAVRKKTQPAYFWAILVIALLMITRPIGVYIGFGSFLYLMYYCPFRLRAAVMATLVSALIFIPAGLHTYQQLRVFHPFRYSAPAKIPRLVESGRWGYHATHSGKSRRGYGWSNPSFHSNPFDPLAKYRTYRSMRKKDMYLFEVDLDKGREDWEKEVKKLKRAYTPERRWMDFKENLVYLFFSRSWPDSSHNKRRSWLEQANFHGRWMWAPLFIVLLLYAPFVRTSEKRAFVLASAWFLLVALIFQESAIVQGRTRKPLEILTIVSIFIMFIRHDRVPENKTFFGWVWYHLHEMSNKARKKLAAK